MLIDTLFAVVILIAIFVLFISTKPSAYKVVQQTTIAAPPIIAFEQVNNFRSWPAWSPYAEMDPDAVYVYSGPSSGKGAKVAWVANKKVGVGNMTILDSRPGEFVRIRLEFIKPFASVNDVEFTFVPQGNQTVVTWSIVGPLSFVFKTMHLLLNMNKIIAGQFSHGLAKLKNIVEGASVVSRA